METKKEKLNRDTVELLRRLRSYDDGRPRAEDADDETIEAVRVELARIGIIKE